MGGHVETCMSAQTGDAATADWLHRRLQENLWRTDPTAEYRVKVQLPPKTPSTQSKKREVHICVCVRHILTQLCVQFVKSKMFIAGGVAGGVAKAHFTCTQKKHTRNIHGNCTCTPLSVYVH